jgi:hypothetical protein
MAKRAGRSEAAVRDYWADAVFLANFVRAFEVART